MNVLNRVYNKHTIDLLSRYVQNGMKVLEIGCGYGELSEVLMSKSQIIYHGIDPDKSAIDKLSNTDNATYFNAKIEEIDRITQIKDIKYDVIFCRWVLAYTDVTNIESNLKLLYSMLNEGGVLICEECDVFKVCVVNKEGDTILLTAMQKWLDLTSKVDKKFSANFSMGSKIIDLLSGILPGKKLEQEIYHPTISDTQDKKILSHGIKSAAKALIDGGLIESREVIDLVDSLRKEIIFDNKVSVKYVESTSVVIGKDTISL